MPNGHDAELPAILARLDERLKHVQSDVAEIKATTVTREEFEPTKRVVYGMVSVTLLAVVTALLTLVVMKGGG